MLHNNNSSNLPLPNNKMSISLLDKTISHLLLNNNNCNNNNLSNSNLCNKVPPLIDNLVILSLLLVLKWLNPEIRGYFTKRKKKRATNLKEINLLEEGLKTKLKTSKECKIVGIINKINKNNSFNRINRLEKLSKMLLVEIS